MATSLFHAVIDSWGVRLDEKLYNPGAILSGPMWYVWFTDHNIGQV